MRAVIFGLCVIVAASFLVPKVFPAWWGAYENGASVVLVGGLRLVCIPALIVLVGTDASKRAGEQADRQSG